MKRSWLIVIFAASMLPGCMLATTSSHKVDYEEYHDDYDFILDDNDGLFDFFDGYSGSGQIYGHGYGYEEVH